VEKKGLRLGTLEPLWLSTTEGQTNEGREHSWTGTRRKSSPDSLRVALLATRVFLPGLRCDIDRRRHAFMHVEVWQARARTLFIRQVWSCTSSYLGLPRILHIPVFKIGFKFISNGLYRIAFFKKIATTGIPYFEVVLPEYLLVFEEDFPCNWSGVKPNAYTFSMVS
jgi:hypothetical protein